MTGQKCSLCAGRQKGAESLLFFSRSGGRTEEEWIRPAPGGIPKNPDDWWLIRDSAYWLVSRGSSSKAICSSGIKTYATKKRFSRWDVSLMHKDYKNRVKIVDMLQSLWRRRAGLFKKKKFYHFLYLVCQLLLPNSGLFYGLFNAVHFWQCETGAA